MRQDFIQHGFLGVESLVRLREVADVQARSESHFTGQRVELTEDRLQKRGLARAVRSDQGRAIQSSQFDIGRAEKNFSGISSSAR